MPRCQRWVVQKPPPLAQSSPFVAGCRWHRIGLAVDMPTPFTFRDLDAWKQGMDLVEVCYKAAGAFPRSELYGLTSQLRRAVVSMPSNVAEGHGRRTTKAYMNHVSIAIGSHAEFSTCLELAGRLGFLSRHETDRIAALSDSVGRLLYGLHRALALRIRKRARAPSNP